MTARNTWFISDTHFGHENIIYHCDRPFEDQHDMDEEMVQLWNQDVKPEDLVYHLGDFAWTLQDTKRVRPLLNGSIRLIVGNHDPIIKMAQTGLFQKMEESRKGGAICEKLKSVVFTHRPIALTSDPGKSTMVNVHGHVHNLKPDTPRHINISVEKMDYRPLHLDALITMIDEKRKKDMS